MTRVGGVRAGVAHIRAAPESARVNKRLAQSKVPTPVLAIGGEISLASKEVARDFAETVTTVVADRRGHWVPEDALVVRNGTIAFVGSEREAARMVGRGTISAEGWVTTCRRCQAGGCSRVTEGRTREKSRAQSLQAETVTPHRAYKRSVTSTRPFAPTAV
jgi:hypothetical protein